MRYTLVETMPNYDSTGAIFKALYDTHSSDFPWLTNYALLDINYIANKSGNKFVSPIINKYIKDNAENEHPEQLTSQQITRLANIIAMQFKTAWQKWWYLNELQYGEDYNPIDNYNMIEVETPNLSRKHSASADYKETNETKTNTDITSENENTNDMSTYGFNSSTDSPTDKSVAGGSTHTTGDKDDNTQTTEHTQSGYTEETETGTRQLTRKGNIGVTQTASMIQKEHQLWLWNFYQQVYRDIDTILTLKIY